MSTVTRRTFIEMGLAVGATVAWGHSVPLPSGFSWHERPHLYAEGVASRNPDSHSILLWARRLFAPHHIAEDLAVELAEGNSFHRVVASAKAPISAARWGALGSMSLCGEPLHCPAIGGGL